MNRFLFAHTTGTEARELVNACLEQIGEVPAEANLGFIYTTDALARELEAIIRLLKQATGIEHWVGTVGIAINVTGHEYYDQPAMAIMIGAFPEDAFRLVHDCTPENDELREAAAGSYAFGVLHGNPDNPQTPQLVSRAAELTGAFLVGGITSSQSENLQVADEVSGAGVSGVLFNAAVPVATRHTQGCTPIGAVHTITRAQRNVLAGLDHRQALAVFNEDIGEVLAKDLQRAAGYIFAALPIPGSDTGDYMVRNIVGVDTSQQLLAIGDYLEEGQALMFCRRDGNSAREDMLRMLDELKHQLGDDKPKGGLYFSCLGRGRHQFGEDSEELRMITEQLGDFPLIGFFANGEIFHGRLYGYTGVLALFH